MDASELLDLITSPQIGALLGLLVLFLAAWVAFRQKSEVDNLRRTLEENKTEFSWESIDRYSIALASRIKNCITDGRLPVFVTTPGAPSIVMARIIESWYELVPQFVFLVESDDVAESYFNRESFKENFFKRSQMSSISKRFLIPKEFQSLINVLEVNESINYDIFWIDDLLFDHSYLVAQRDSLRSLGASRCNIIHCGLIAHQSLISSVQKNKNSHEPIHILYEKKTVTDELILPWSDEKLENS